jgi:polysaccharide biosynthesis/export protein
MTRQVRSFLAWRRVAVLATIGWITAVAQAQTVSVGDSAQIFQNLSAEQQQAILERLNSPVSAGQSNVPAGTGAFGSLPTGRDDTRRRGVGDEPAQVAVLRAEDTIVVELSLPPDPVDERGSAPRSAPKSESGAQGQSSAGLSASSATNGLGEASIRRRQRMLEELTPEGRRKLLDLVQLVHQGNPYLLDSNAQLVLPGFTPIPLGGLTEEQATQRLSFEPILLPLEVRVTKLPLARTGVSGLKHFGYDLFDAQPGLSPAVFEGPVPADYVVGPGDQLKVQLFGTQNRILTLVVNRDGSVNFPELGPIAVGGMSFAAAKRELETRATRQMIGVRASVSMGAVGSIRVWVTGEARQPGSYAISGLATVTTALFASGGVNSIGSLRDIQLKRQGQTVRRLDLYDMLVSGDTRNDAKLLPGDVIHIPPVGATISVDGEVKRPAIYELRGETGVGKVVELAGGLTPEADATRASLVHMDDGKRLVIEVNLRAQGASEARVGNGDVLRVSRLRPQVDSGVTLEGFVYRPGPVAWRVGLRLSDVIASVDELRPNADQHYVLVRRESGPERRISVVSADLTAALARRGSAADIGLQPRDRIMVFDLAPGRERIIMPLLDELRLQSSLGEPTQLVRIEGKVKVPGEYPLETGMRVSDLLRAGGNLDNAAYGGKADLARYRVTAAGARQAELIEIDLGAVRAGDSSADEVLQPFDYLFVKETTDWGRQESVTLKGEVRFPGKYPIRKGETLKEVLTRAGGLTSLAFAKGAAFTREELKQREQKQLDVLGEKLQSDLAAMSLRAANANQAGASQALLSSESLIMQLKGSKAVGRMVIDLPRLLTGDVHGSQDVDLRDGDLLVVPRQSQEVTVIGEVQSATSHFYNPSLKRDDYIAKSGGMTRRADKAQVYVVHADGNVVARRSTLFARDFDVAIQPGDTVVVPMDTERLPSLPFWQAVTSIIYNLAVSVAAVNSF